MVASFGSLFCVSASPLTSTIAHSLHMQRGLQLSVIHVLLEIHGRVRMAKLAMDITGHEAFS